MFEALVEEVDSWWIQVEGELKPTVTKTQGRDAVSWTSPFVRWPGDKVSFRCHPFESGSRLELLHEGEADLHPMEHAALKHRWGQHLDQDLRGFVDDGYPSDPYRFTPYRVDLEDWSVSDRVRIEQQWHAEVDLWCSVVHNPDHGWSFQREHILPAGSVVWVVGRRHHQMAVRCLPLEPADLEERLVTDGFRHYETDAIELLIPLADFAGRMRPLGAG